jgi:hypothetical protein
MDLIDAANWRIVPTPGRSAARQTCPAEVLLQARDNTAAQDSHRNKARTMRQTGARGLSVESVAQCRQTLAQLEVLLQHKDASVKGTNYTEGK